MSDKHVVYHIPVCPFSQRLEILLELKGRRDAADFRKIDITEPRPNWLLDLTRGTTALPVLVTPQGQVIKESLVILRYLEEVFADPPIARRDPYERAVENMAVTMEGPLVGYGYRFILNQDPTRRPKFENELFRHFGRLNDFLTEHSQAGPFLFDCFGWAETVFTPIFMRFWFLDYFEGFDVPDDARFARVRAWREACLTHPQAQQVSREEIVKLYYDYAQGAGNGALVSGRKRSSFVFEPHWAKRPWPPRKKYGTSATDRELGLLE